MLLLVGVFWVVVAFGWRGFWKCWSVGVLEFTPGPVWSGWVARGWNVGLVDVVLVGGVCSCVGGFRWWGGVGHAVGS